MKYLCVIRLNSSLPSFRQMMRHHPASIYVFGKVERKGLTTFCLKKETINMQNTSENSPIHYRSAEMERAEKAFREAYPEFNNTFILDELRASEYTRLDELKHIYLDYTGGGLYADCQLRDHMELLRQNVFGNHHSHNPPSREMTEICEHARAF